LSSSIASADSLLSSTSDSSKSSDKVLFLNGNGFSSVEKSRKAKVSLKNSIIFSLKFDND
jgi:hypothetical protein